MNQDYLIYLHQFIAEHFDLEELEQLCLKLGVKHENLGSATLDGKALDLVRLMQRRNELDLLAAEVSRTRPGNFDPPPPPRHPPLAPRHLPLATCHFLPPPRLNLS